jgi:hypothetical protein
MRWHPDRNGAANGALDPKDIERILNSLGEAVIWIEGD